MGQKGTMWKQPKWCWWFGPEKGYRHVAKSCNTIWQTISTSSPLIPILFFCGGSQCSIFNINTNSALDNIFFTQSLGVKEELIVMKPFMWRGSVIMVRKPVSVICFLYHIKDNFCLMHIMYKLIKHNALE